MQSPLLSLALLLAVTMALCRVAVGEACTCGEGQGRGCGRCADVRAQRCEEQCGGQPQQLVCGSDGLEYSSACLAECMRVEVMSEGQCPCACPFIFNPVCGSDGTTSQNFDSPCQAECAGYDVSITPGRCPCSCPLLYLPVCGDDRNTYDNECTAECAGVTVVSQGRCPCACSFLYLPVCGDDRNTYDNECLAQCAGANVASQGPCP